MTPRTIPKARKVQTSSAGGKADKGTVVSEDARLRAKADRTREYMSAARRRQQELERGGCFF